MSASQEYERKPADVIVLKERRCLRCDRKFKARGRVLESGRWTCIQHLCHSCTETRRSRAPGFDEDLCVIA